MMMMIIFILGEGRVCNLAHTWRLENSLHRSARSLHHVDPRGWRWITKLGSKHL